MAGFSVVKRGIADTASRLPKSAVSAISLQTAVAAPSGDTTGAKDTPLIQAALNACNTAGGGLVKLAPGTYYVNATLTFYTNTRIEGAGRAVTIVQLANGANVDMFVSNGFAGLTGGGTSGGVVSCGFFNLTIDGNKGNNASGGDGIKHYGALLDIGRVIVRNCKVDGVYSEWSTSAVLTDGVEAHVDWLSSHDNGGSGIVWAGPHDSTFKHCLTFLNGAKGFWTKAGSAITVFETCHSWGVSQTYAWYIESESHMTECQAESASVAQVMLGAPDCVWEGGKVFGLVGQPMVGIQMGDGSHLAPTGLKVVTKTHQCESGAIDFTNCGTNPWVEIENDQTTGSVIIGSVPATAVAIFHSVGVTTGAVANFPDAVTFRGGANAIQVVGSNSKFNVNSSSGAVDFSNGALLRFNQGAFTNQVAGINAATGAIQPGNFAGGVAALGAGIYSGSGAPSKPGNVNPVAGDFYLRTDTPSTANQRIYICTTGGAAPVWSGIA